MTIYLVIGEAHDRNETWNVAAFNLRKNARNLKNKLNATNVANGVHYIVCDVEIRDAKGGK